MKLTKYKSHKIYGCPTCWEKLGDPKINENGEKRWSCKIHTKGARITNNPMVFDSQAEYRTGQTLMTLEESGEICHLLHHKTFDLLPRIYLCGPGEGGCYNRILPEGEVARLNAVMEIPHKFRHYESDFTFIQNGKKKAVEVKGLTHKNTTRKVRDVQGEKLNVSIKIPWPFFTREQPLSQFRTKAQLLKAIYKLDVEIWAGPLVFKFDEKWKLVEVIK